MTEEQFEASLEDDNPPGLNVLTDALWYDANGNWHKAHELIQDLETREAALIHAYLHRKEGDNGNASYWYHRAGENMPRVALPEEWKQLVARFISQS